MRLFFLVFIDLVIHRNDFSESKEIKYQKEIGKSNMKMEEQ